MGSVGASVEAAEVAVGTVGATVGTVDAAVAGVGAVENALKSQVRGIPPPLSLCMALRNALKTHLLQTT